MLPWLRRDGGEETSLLWTAPRLHTNAPGSTGVPKAVPIRQRGLANYLATLTALLRVQAGERVLNVFSLHFDAAIEQIALPLFAGATLCMGTRALLWSGPTILSFLKRHRITHAAFTPSWLSALPASELLELCSIICGGERCAPGLADEWGQGRQFVNIYGPTECTIGATFAECSPGGQREESTVPKNIGKHECMSSSCRHFAS
jgi:non-ribosomal peptide synthetase component F